MFSSLMGGIYWLISQVMLFWHEIGDKVLPGGRVLGTNWPWVLSIVFLVITVRVVLFPVFVKQIKSQRAMQAIQPKVKELQEKYKGDRESLQKEVMKLYQAEKVNPLMGCLPMFLQIPVFIGLLHVLRHVRPGQSDGQKQLYGWSIPEFDDAVLARLFNAPIVAKFSSGASELAGMAADSLTVKVVTAILVLLMITTTYLTQLQMIKKTGWNEDPQQRMIQKFLLYGVPFFTLTSGWYFPIGVIIYWVTNNFITLGQQYWVLHKYPPPKASTTMKPAAKVGASPNGARGSEAKSGGIFAAFTRTVREAAGAGRGVDGTKSSNAKPSTKANVKTDAKTNNAKTNAKTDGKNGAAPPGAAKPGAAGRSLAPRPGAKPINPKKGGAAKRQSG